MHRPVQFRTHAPVVWAALALSIGCSNTTDPLASDAGAPDLSARDAGVRQDGGDPTDLGPRCQGPDTCDSEGATRCAQSGQQQCEANADGCLNWSAPQACPGPCIEGRCHSCEGEAGTFRTQPFELEGETRRYFLHVPASYICDQATAILMDFHGTAIEPPEEAYGTPALTALADQEGFIVVRPRSRSSLEGGQEIFRWDQNRGDLDKNTRYALALLADLQARYHIDPARIYASGFSSGSNMTSQLLSASGGAFSGFAPMAGGIWQAPPVRELSDGQARVYSVTGYKDYLVAAADRLREGVTDANLPTENFFERKGNFGHELYDWAFGEAWRFLDRGERDESAPLAAGWMQDMGFSDPVDLLHLSPTADNAILASSAQGRLYRWAGGTWTLAGQDPQGRHLTGVCAGPNGEGIAVGAQAVLRTIDHGQSFTPIAPIPEQGPTFFGDSYLNSAACSITGRIVVGGYWTSAHSDDPTVGWAPAPMEVFDFPAQVSSIATSSTGAFVATGGFYVGYSDDGVNFSPANAAIAGWMNDAAWAGGDRWFAVGDHGMALRSEDGGRSFQALALPLEADFYAVAAMNAQTAAIVGSRGVVLLTEDGGNSWSDISIGPDKFLGDALFVDSRLLVAGEDGLVLWRDIAP